MTDELVTKEIFIDRDELYDSGSLTFLNYLAGASDRIGPWWSQNRDIQLKAIVKDSDHLSGTVATIIDAISTIPVNIIPRNQSRISHIAQGEKFTSLLLYNSSSRSNPTARGYSSMIKPAIQDYYSTDNGLFIAIDGPGKPDGPITGMPTKLIHLDSTKCTRTSSVEYPVIYTERGKRYKLHQSRVIAMSASPDSDFDMNGVGFCSVSRAINSVQHLIDIGRYEQEKLGSRPMRALMHIEGGGQREVKAMDNLLQKFSIMADNQGFSRYSKIPVFGSTGTINLIDFASLPDGFDKLTSTQLAMSLLALAFGVSTRFLAFAIGVSGTTRADAEVQEEGMKSKGIATFINDFSEQLNLKFLPSHLKTNYDWQDDSQDEKAAQIRKLRAEGRKIDLESGVTTTTIERQMMVEDGELTVEQYEELEQPAITDNQPIDNQEEVKAQTFSPPESARNNARKVLEWRDKYPREIRGMTRIGWTRASQLASGKPISLDTVKRMAAFNRHRKNATVAPEYKDKPWRDAGYVAFLGWGGKTGIDWAIKVSQANKKKELDDNGPSSFELDTSNRINQFYDLFDLQSSIDNNFFPVSTIFKSISSSVSDFSQCFSKPIDSTWIASDTKSFFVPFGTNISIPIYPSSEIISNKKVGNRWLNKVNSFVRDDAPSNQVSFNTDFVKSNGNGIIKLGFIFNIDRVYSDSNTELSKMVNIFDVYTDSNSASVIVNDNRTIGHNESAPISNSGIIMLKEVEIPSYISPILVSNSPIIVGNISTSNKSINTTWATSELLCKSHNSNFIFKMLINDRLSFFNWYIAKISHNSSVDNVSNIIPHDISDNKIKDKSTFRQSLRSAAWELSTGQSGIFPFVTGLYSAIEREYTNAWNEGAAACNIQPEDRTAEEQAKLEEMILQTKSYVFNLGEWITESEPKWTSIADRLNMWTMDYDLVKNTAQNMACSNQKAVWRLGATEQHCKSCAGFNGRVYRRSVWEKNGAIPRSRSLECNGYKCDCRLEDTDQPVTKGKFPASLMK